MPTLSVLMAVYNDTRFLREAVSSVRAQTFADFEFIIVDDGSNEETGRRLDEYAAADARIIVKHTPHCGLTRALNTGLALAHGVFVARMDADDVARSERFALQVQFLQSHSSVAACGTQAVIINEAGEAIGQKTFSTDASILKKRLLFNNQFVHASLCFRTQILLDAGGYDESFVKSQDYELMLRLASKYEVANLPETLMSWRLRRASSSWSGKRQEWDAIRARVRAITKYGYPKLRGLWHIFMRCVWLFVPQSFKFKRYEV